MKEDGEFPVTRLRCALLLVRLAGGGSKKEQLEKALEYAETTLRTDKEHAGRAYFVRGTVYKASGENEKSREDIEKARQSGFDGDEEWFFEHY